MAAPPAGELNEYVDFQAPTVGRDAVGGFTQSFASSFNRWVSIRARTGDEFWIADQTRANVTHTITARYDTAITEAHQIVLGTRTFSIGAVLDRDGTRESMQLLCVEQTGGASS